MDNAGLVLMGVALLCAFGIGYFLRYTINVANLVKIADKVSGMSEAGMVVYLSEELNCRITSLGKEDPSEVVATALGLYLPIAEKMDELDRPMDRDEEIEIRVYSREEEIVRF